MESKRKPNKTVKTENKKALTKEEKQELKKLGLAIMQKRIYNGISSEAFANSYDFSRTHFGDIERGEINVGIIIFFRILKGLDITPLEFFTHYHKWAEEGAETRKQMDEKKRKPKKN